MSKISIKNFFYSLFSAQIIKKNRKIWLCILVLLAIDLTSKYGFYDLRIGEACAFLEPVFNHGISRWIRINKPLILVLSVLGIWFFSFFWQKKQISNWIFILLIAGTLGNLIDRVWLGGVRDFIAIGDFPVFNIADCYLSIAVMILLKKEIFPCNWEKKQ